jgi:hypothetical protein
MAYIGAVAPGYDPTRASVPQLDAERFSGDASTTAFTLTRQVASPTDINVIVENVLQEPTVAYSVNGYTLTFTEAPGTGTNNIYVVYRASAVSNFAYVPDGSITYAKLANNIRQFTVDTFTANGTGSTIALTETPASANSLIVSVDGVIQTAPTNYTLSGSTITFTGVPDNGANVVVKHIGFRTTSTVTALQASSVTSTELADGSVTNAKLAGSITSNKITSVSNTAITGNIISSQITSVANTQITGILSVTNGGTGASTLAGANIPVTTATNSFTGLQTFTGSSSVAGAKIFDVLEGATISATAATGTINYDITTQAVLYYTSNASGNWTVNFRGSSGTSANTLMATGESMTVAFLVTQGSTAYYNSAVQVDGNSVTPKWQGGTAPAAGNASSVDVYSYTIIKTGSAAFTVFAAQTKFA